MTIQTIPPETDSHPQKFDLCESSITTHRASYSRTVSGSLIDALLHNARKFPDRTAFISNTTTGRETLTYSELVSKACQLASYLLDIQVRPGDRIAIALPRGLETPIAIFGTLLVNGVYVPLDATQPVDSINRILEECAATTIISAKPLRKAIEKLVNSSNSQVKNIVGIENMSAPSSINCVDWGYIAQLKPDLNTAKLDKDSLAYIIYTSGSTGQPKGIAHTHSSAMAYIQLVIDSDSLRENETVASHSPSNTDMSTLGLLAAPILGAQTLILSESEVRLPTSLGQALRENNVSVLYCVPYALIQLLSNGALEHPALKPLRRIVYAGEALAPVHVSSLLSISPTTTISNHYGPAETNVCTWFDIPKDKLLSDWLNPGESIPIGKLWSQNECLVLNERNEPVAMGDIGELLIRSPSAMQGYWQQPKDDEYVWFETEDRKLFYRTGDLVELTQQHGFRLVGRIGRQVKIRGFRVELDQVELELSSMEGIEEVASITVAGENYENELHIAVKLEPSVDIEINSILAYAARKLPLFSVPSKVHVLHQFPRTTSGKIDRLKLANTLSLQG